MLKLSIQKIPWEVFFFEAILMEGKIKSLSYFCEINRNFYKKNKKCLNHLFWVFFGNLIWNKDDTRCTQHYCWYIKLIDPYEIRMIHTDEHDPYESN